MADGRRLVARVLAALGMVALVVGAACSLVAPSDATYSSAFGRDAMTDAALDGRLEGGGAEGGCWNWCEPLPGADVGSWTFSPGSRPDSSVGTIVDAGHCGAALSLDGTNLLHVTDPLLLKPEVWVAFWLVDIASFPDGTTHVVGLGGTTKSNPGVELRVGDAGPKLGTHPTSTPTFLLTNPIRPVRVVMHAIEEAGVELFFYNDKCESVHDPFNSGAGSNLSWSNPDVLWGDGVPIVVDDMWISTVGPPAH